MKTLHAALLCFLAVSLAHAGQLELDKKWIQQHMNRATAVPRNGGSAITFHIKEAKKSINPVGSGADDGDLHIAGSSDDTGLPMVAEIVNACRSKADAVKFAQNNSGKDVALNGVWRLWFEHPPTGKQKQFANNPISGPATNPDHMFEIHPITSLATFDLNANLGFVQECGGTTRYQGKPNDATFGSYERLTIDSWSVTNDSVIIESKKAGYNYADFVIRLEETPKPIPNEAGRYMALADVLDTDCSQIVSNGKPVVAAPRRMVFVENDAGTVIAKAKLGSTFHVMGIPRVNLERLTYFLNHADDFNGKKVALPYEMIIIGAEPKTGCKAGTAKSATPNAGQPASPAKSDRRRG